MKRPRPRSYPVSAYTPGIEITPLGNHHCRIDCQACGAHSEVGAGLPLLEPARQIKFNRSVEGFYGEHKACFKEGK